MTIAVDLGRKATKQTKLYPGHGTKMWLLYLSWDVQKIFGLLVSHVYCYNSMFLKQYHAGLEGVMHIVLAP